MIVGVSGVARSGKDTVAENLVFTHGFVKVSFADALKQELANILAISKYPLGSIEFDNEVKRYLYIMYSNSHEKELMRELMQAYGEYKRREYPDYFVEKVSDFIASSDHKNFVIPDVRHHNEANAIKRWGGMNILVKREASGLSGELGNHESERYVNDLYRDFTILNNSTIDSLHKNSEIAVFEFFKSKL